MAVTIAINSITTTIEATIAPTLEPPELSEATAGVIVAVVVDMTLAVAAVAVLVVVDLADTTIEVAEEALLITVLSVVVVVLTPIVPL